MSAKEAIRLICKERNIKVSKLEEDLGLANGTLAKSGDIMSNTLLAIAKYLNVSMEYLLGEDVSGHSISDFEYEIIRSYRTADKSIKEFILNGLKLVEYPDLNEPQTNEVEYPVLTEAKELASVEKKNATNRKNDRKRKAK